MPKPPASVKDYLEALPDERRTAIQAVREAVNAGLPKGYEEGIQYGMIGWYVPHRRYPAGYHCDPKQPVPFASLASQKNHMAVYLTCIYGDEKHRAWFVKEWAKTGKRLDMGKSCVRFRRLDDLPLELITEAVRRVPVDAFLAHYESVISHPPRRTGVKKAAVATKRTAKKAAAAKKRTAKKATGAKKRTTRKAAAAKKRTTKKATAAKTASRKKRSSKTTTRTTSSRRGR